jgi:hypothetical protein
LHGGVWPVGVARGMAAHGRGSGAPFGVLLAFLAMSVIKIPPPRIPVIDQRTGMMAQAWYAFFSQFLQGARNDVVDLTVGMGSLTSRVLVAENDVDALQGETANLFVDHAMSAVPDEMQ